MQDHYVTGEDDTARHSIHFANLFMPTQQVDYVF